MAYKPTNPKGARSLPVFADKATLFKFPPASFAAPSFAQAPINHYSQVAAEEAELAKASFQRQAIHLSLSQANKSLVSTIHVLSFVVDRVELSWRRKRVSSSSCLSFFLSSSFGPHRRQALHEPCSWLSNDKDLFLLSLYSFFFECECV